MAVITPEAAWYICGVKQACAVLCKSSSGQHLTIGSTGTVGTAVTANKYCVLHCAAPTLLPALLRPGCLGLHSAALQGCTADG
jgi:hypothetical protein